MSTQLELVHYAAADTTSSTHDYRLGIDPGITGALALICGHRLVRVWDMPVVKKSSGKGQQVSAAGLVAVLGEVEGEIGCEHLRGDSRPSDHRHWGHAFLELVSAMPGQGVTGMFSLGKSAGVVEGVLAARGWPVTMVAPARWKRRAGLLKTEKDASRARALQLFPGAAAQLARKKDSGRADAMLIAAFGA